MVRVVICVFTVPMWGSKVVRFAVVFSVLMWASGVIRIVVVVFPGLMWVIRVVRFAIPGGIIISLFIFLYQLILSIWT